MTDLIPRRCPICRGAGIILPVEGKEWCACSECKKEFPVEYLTGEELEITPYEKLGEALEEDGFRGVYHIVKVTEKQIRRCQRGRYGICSLNRLLENKVSMAKILLRRVITERWADEDEQNRGR